MNRHSTFAILLALYLGTAAIAAERVQLRRPVAMAVSPDGSRLYTANQSSGTVSVINVARQSVSQEIAVTGNPSDLALLADGQHMLVTDESQHALVLLARTPTSWKIAARLKTAPYPVGVVVDRQGRRAYVASLWSRAVTVVNLKPSTKNGALSLTVAKRIRLPFAPRKLCLAKDDSRLIVAGSFGGVLGVIDTHRNRLLTTKTLQGHNIRGLSLTPDGKRLLTAQQTLNPLARSTFDDVHWGNMFSNVLYSFAIDDVCDPKADQRKDRRATHLGRPGNATGDPGAIAVAKGRTAIVISGVNEVAIARDLEQPLNRVSVGIRPTAVTISRDGERVFVAEKFSDSVSIVDAKTSKRIANISLGPQPKLTTVQRGEQLFFDARLSLEGWMSCHSCHTDGHTNGRLNDNLSDGSFGAPKRVLSLLGVAETAPWAWKGDVARLEEQVKSSVHKTMQGKPISDERATAIAAYIKTLRSAPPIALFDAVEKTKSIARGRQLFQKHDCRRCHTPPTYTSTTTYDVGLKDAVGNAKFNPPSLRGAGRRTRFFHDGRAKSIEEVLSRYRHQLPKAISKSERNDLIEFLRTL